MKIGQRGRLIDPGKNVFPTQAVTNLLQKKNKVQGRDHAADLFEVLRPMDREINNLELRRESMDGPTLKHRHFYLRRNVRRLKNTPMARMVFRRDQTMMKLDPDLPLVVKKRHHVMMRIVCFMRRIGTLAVAKTVQQRCHRG